MNEIITIRRKQRLHFAHFEAAKTNSYLRIAYSFSIVSTVNIIGVKHYRKMVSS
jgi:hypothetical protein